jgi:hypothetical protein
MIINKYILKKDLPNLTKGVVFEHRTYDKNHPDRGNMGCGVLILGWVNGDCQEGWCGETYTFPGQLINNTEWFERINDTKEDLLSQIDELKRKINKL